MLKEKMVICSLGCALLYVDLAFRRHSIMSLPSQQLVIAGNVLDSRLAVSVSAFYIKHHPDVRGIEPLDKELKIVTVCFVSHETLV